MGRHTPEYLGTQGSTIELPTVDTIESGRHRGGGRASWRAHWGLDSRAGKRRAKPTTRTHRRTSYTQAAVLAGVGAFSVTAVVLGVPQKLATSPAPSQRPEGAWVVVRPGSAAGAPGGQPVASAPRPTVHTGTPSPSPTAQSATPRAVLPAPVGSPGSSSAPEATTPSVSGAGSSPSAAADPTETASTPVPAPAPTMVKKRCRRSQ